VARSELGRQEAGDVLVDLDPRDPVKAVGLDGHRADLALSDERPHGGLADAKEYGRLPEGQEQRGHEATVVGASRLALRTLRRVLQTCQSQRVWVRSSGSTLRSTTHAAPYLTAVSQEFTLAAC
jgi:hypothetical protein